MRKILFTAGIIMIAAALTGLALTDTQLRILLLGTPQTSTFPQGQGGFQPGAQFGNTPPAALAAGGGNLTLQLGYFKAILYLLAEGGLALTIIGVIFPLTRKGEQALIVQGSSQPAPWDHPDMAGFTPKSTSTQTSDE